MSAGPVADARDARPDAGEPAGVMGPAVPAAPGAGRLTSLDAFRGLAIAGMILVNNPGSWSHIHPPLAHAAWHGWTPTDLIFPFFLFIVGVAVLLLPPAPERGAATSSDTWPAARRCSSSWGWG